MNESHELNNQLIKCWVNSTQESRLGGSKSARKFQIPNLETWNKSWPQLQWLLEEAFLEGLPIPYNGNHNRRRIFEIGEPSRAKEGNPHRIQPLEDVEDAIEEDLPILYPQHTFHTCKGITINEIENSSRDK